MRKAAVYMRMAIGAFAAFSGTFLVMPLVSANTGSLRKVLVPGLGILFWMLLICGCVFTGIALQSLKKATAVHLKRKLRFFSNPEAIAADVGLIVSVCIALWLAIFDSQKQFAYFAECFLASLSISMHFILNGECYRILRDKRRNGK